MRVAYLDCASGISGDMMLAALVDAGVDLSAVQAGIASLGLPSCQIFIEEVERRGFRAAHLVVKHEPEHVHRHLNDIVNLIEGSELSGRQQGLAKKIFSRLATAEAKVHGTTVEAVHFHEVGAVDSIVDIVGVAIAWDLLGVEKTVSSPVPTGKGFIEIAHGRCSLPAPATGELLRGIPLLELAVEGELTTPTGAAILSTIVDQFGSLPSMVVERIGYGAGSRDHKAQANLLRLLVGCVVDAPDMEQLWVVETNLDDISGELVGYCTGQLFDHGALDVATTAIQMKKNRPGIKLEVLCRASELECVEAVLFRETTTLGVRRWQVERRAKSRRRHRVTTPWGEVDGMLASEQHGVATYSPEYESCRRVAAERRIPLKAVYEAAQRAFASDEERSRGG